MSEKWSEFAQRMEDKEGWLAPLLEKEPDESGDALGLYATASLLRGAVNAAEVPESVQSQSRAQGLALLEENYGERRPSSSPSSPSWLGQLGSWLQVAFNLFRRR
jgi:hypothetical protein